MQPLLPMLAFAFATSITPGPNNTLVMLTAANWGFRASLPVFFGVVSGFLLMVFAVGLGLGGLFAAWPVAHTVLKWVCFAWLLVLAFRIARAGRPALGQGAAGRATARPLSFWQIAVFQWVNPKAWMMAVGAIALFVPVGAEPLVPVLRVLLAFVLAGAPCVLAWALFGVWIARFLTSPRRVTVFNTTMAVLLVLSMLPTLF
jgi:threonine/homoserine/homoserine lactone efflux protein